MIKKLIAIICFLLFLPGCAFAIRYDGPYEGRVIDADTGQPIEGVVVLGVWYKQNPGPGGAVSEYYDAMETVTDKNGEFKINGLGLLIISNIIPMDVLIFKAGYEYESGLWSALKKYAKKIKWEGDKAIIPLKKLTMEERRRQDIPDIYIGERIEGGVTHSCIPKNIKLIPKEVNKELLEQGRKPFELEGECEK